MKNKLIIGGILALVFLSSGIVIGWNIKPKPAAVEITEISTIETSQDSTKTEFIPIDKPFVTAVKPEVLTKESAEVKYESPNENIGGWLKFKHNLLTGEYTFIDSLIPAVKTQWLTITKVDTKIVKVPVYAAAKVKTFSTHLWIGYAPISKDFSIGLTELIKKKVSIGGHADFIFEDTKMKRLDAAVLFIDVGYIF